MGLAGFVPGTQALPQPPPSLTAWQKVLWSLRNTVQIGTELLKFDFGGVIDDVSKMSTQQLDVSWRRLNFHFQSTVSTLRADDQYFKLDFVNYTDGHIDNTWTTGDYGNFQTAIAALMTTMAADFSLNWKFAGWSSYVMAFNDYTFEPKPNYFPPFAQSGAPEFESVADIPFTGPSTIAPQVSSTVTLETPSRKHWGRLYLPTLAATTFAASGRLGPGVVNQFHDAFHTMLTTLAGAQFFCVVPTTQVNGKPSRNLQNVTAVHVDDVSDVVRRRRWREPTLIVSS